MPKDAKGHGSNKRTYEFKDGDRSYKGLHSSFGRALEAARHAGLKSPNGGLKESKATQAANQKKAIAAFKAGHLAQKPSGKVTATTKNRKY